MPKKPLWLIKFTFELVKYRASKILGNEGLSTLFSGLTDIVGDEIIENISNLLALNEKAERLIMAFTNADDCFIKTIDDDQLKQAVISKPLANIERLEIFAKKLPSTLDDQGFQELITSQFREDWGNYLNENQINKAGKTYLECLDRCLAAEVDQILPTIYRKIERIEKSSEKIIQIQEYQIEVLKNIVDRQIKQDEKNKQRMIISQGFKNIIQVTPPDSAPQFPYLYLEREKLLQDLQEKLNQYSWLALVDSSGKGKTLIAKAISEQFLNKKKWISLKYQSEPLDKHFRDQIAIWYMELKNDNNIWNSYFNGLLSLQNIASEIGLLLGEVGLLIIDDLPEQKNNDVFYYDLDIVAKIFFSYQIKIISTSQRDLPVFFQTNYPARIIKESIKPLNQNEILELLHLAGAPNQYQKEGTSLWINALSKGHPGLVVGIIGWLKQQDWKYSKSVIDNLINGLPVKEIQEKSRQYLFNTLEDSQKELIYRLSLIGDNFSRQLAYDIARIPPEIRHFGEVIDHLLGPWIDRLENDQYNISPLIGDAGRDNLSFEIQQEIHREIVFQLMPNKVITVMNAHNILLHLWQAKDYIQFAQVLLVILIEIKTKAEADYLEWTTAILHDIPWPDELDINWRIIIYASQLRVLSLLRKNILIQTAKLEDLLENANPAQNLFAIIYAHITIFLMSQEIPIEITINNSFRFLNLIFSNLKQVQDNFDEDLVKKVPNLVWSQVMRIQGSEKIQLFFEKVTKLSYDERKYLFSGTFTLEACINLMDQIWFSEASKPEESRNWQEVLLIVDRFEEYPIFQEQKSLSVAAAHSRSVIYSDYLLDNNKAIELLQQFTDLENFDDNFTFIKNYCLALNFSDTKNIDKALQHFEIAEATNGESFFHYRLDNTRRLAIELSRKENYPLARKMCIKTIHKFDQSIGSGQYKWDKLEMFGELAFVHWKTNNWMKACACMYGFVREIVKEEILIDDPRFKETFIKAGHGLGWFASIVDNGTPPQSTLDGDSYTPVFAGLFGIPRMNLRKIIPKIKYSKAILLTQTAQFSFGVGLFRIAWKCNKLSLKYYEFEEVDKDNYLGIILPDLAILEMFFGDLINAFEYSINSVYSFALIFKTGKLLSNSEREVNNSQIIESDLREVEKYNLYFFLVPIFMLFIGLKYPNNVIEYKINELEKLYQENEQVYDRIEWFKILEHFKEIIGNWENERRNGSDFIAFGDENLFKIIESFLDSVKIRMSLKDSFITQLNSCIGLASYGAFGKRMLIGIGKILHEYWFNIAIKQRFALHNPDIFYHELENISPNMGGRTIVKILKKISIALQIYIPKEALKKIESLY